MEQKTLWFESGGKQNTAATLDAAKRRATELGIKQIVVASSHGDTAQMAHRVFAPLKIKVVAVSICHGWEDEGWTMSTDERADLEKMGVTVHTGIHALGDGVGSAFSEKFGGRCPEEIVRDTLYCFSQGMKVAVECLLMAADAGLIALGEETIAIGGTSAGADTAIVCLPTTPRAFHKLEIREILAKPRIP